MLKARVKSRKPHEKMFKISKQKYRLAWMAIASFLGVNDMARKPHGIRHTGASYDCFVGYRNLKEIQRRGRCASDASALRYAKSHMYTRSLAQTPSAILAAGQQLISALGERSKHPAN